MHWDVLALETVELGSGTRILEMYAGIDEAWRLGVDKHFFQRHFLYIPKLGPFWSILQIP